MKLPNMVFEKHQAITAMELVIADNKYGVFELMDEVGVLFVIPVSDPITDKATVGHITPLLQG